MIGRKGNRELEVRVSHGKKNERNSRKWVYTCMSLTLFVSVYHVNTYGMFVMP